MSVRRKAAIAALSLLLLAGAVSLGVPDRGDPGDSDVALESASALPPAANAYSDLLALDRTFQPSNEERKKIIACRADPRCAGDELAPLLARSAPALRLLDAFRTKDFQAPELADVARLGPDMKNPPMHQLLQAAWLQLIGARRAAAAGRRAEAAETALRLAEAGQRLEASAGLSIQYFAGSILKLQALEELRRAAAAGLPAQAASGARARLAPLRPSEDGFRRALRSEYMLLADTLRRVESGQPVRGRVMPSSLGRKLTFKPNRTLALYAQDYRGWIADVGRCAAREPRPRKSTVRLMLESLAGGNLGGRLLHENSAAPDFPRLALRLCEERFYLGATEVALAAAAFASAKGRRPESPAELVPDQLPALPQDPYVGGPLRYVPATGALVAGGTDFDGKDLVVPLR